MLIWVSITDVFCIFLSSWKDDVFNYATRAAFQILFTSLTLPSFDTTSTGNVVKRDNRSLENYILILNFRRVLIVVSFLLGKSPASVYCCMPTFRNSLSVPSSKAVVEH